MTCYRSISMTAATNRKARKMDAVKTYYEVSTEYRKSLKTAWDEYHKGHERLQAYKGSEGYEKELAEIQDKRDAAIKAARDKAEGRYKTVISYMRKAIEAQPAQTPTEEQMRTLTALKMREKVSVDELEKVAEQMRGVDMAVSVLDEIAQKNGSAPGRFGEYMGATGRASAAVDKLVSDANLTLKLTRPDSGKQRHEAHHAAKWGGEWDERHEGIALNPMDSSNSYALSHVDRDFKDEREMMREFADVGDRYSEFRSTVNYNPGVKPGLQKIWGEV